MSDIGIFLLVNVFSALLPPTDPSERDYYEILGLLDNANVGGSSRNLFFSKLNTIVGGGKQRKIKLEEIKKAYKKKSLQLHPDKIAQRRNFHTQQSIMEAAAEYELVQEAYSVLSDGKLRKRYHSLGCSPTRYRFIMNAGSMTNPSALHDNLVQASFRDKTRLVAIVTIAILLCLLQPILIAVKVNHILFNKGDTLQTVHWIVVLIPLWVFHGIYILFLIAMTFIVLSQTNKKQKQQKQKNAQDKDPENNNNNEQDEDQEQEEDVEITFENKLLMILPIVEHLLWYIGYLLLALKWDTLLSTPYSVLFIPIYLAILLQWIQSLVQIRHIQKDMDKMVSEIYFKSEILHNVSLQELSLEERKELEKKYILVQTPPELELLFQAAEHDPDNPDEPSMTEAAKEKERVMASKEYESASAIVEDSKKSIRNWILFGIPFLVLILIKIDKIALQQASWWIVFIPIWIVLGVRMFSSFFTCCCYAPEVELAMEMEEEKKEQQEQEEKEKKEKEEQEKKEKEEQVNKELKQDAATTDETKKEEDKKDTKENADKQKDENGTKVTDTETTATPVVDVAEDQPFDEQKDANQKSKDAEEDETSAFIGSKDKSNTKTEMEKQLRAIDNYKNGLDDTTTNNEDDNDRLIGETAQEKKDLEAGDTNTSTDKNKQKEGEDGDDDDDISFIFDEETFQAYQSAYAEVETLGMEKRAKAQGTCCMTCFQLMILILFVFKLNVAYDAVHNTDDEDGDISETIGYNTLWILFPFFLIAGIVLCCCSCLIYGAGSVGDVKPTDDEDGNEDTTANTNNKQEQDQPIIFTPPPPPTPPPAAVEESATTITPVAAAASPEQPKEDTVKNNMDDDKETISKNTNITTEGGSTEDIEATLEDTGDINDLD